MTDIKLFMLLLGCTPKGRYTEQHDIFFGIGNSLASLVPEIINSWPEAEGAIHIDAWRQVTCVDKDIVQVVASQQPLEGTMAGQNRLFFINLGGYKHGEFEEFHYKMLIACENKAAAIQQSKATAFYRHTGFKGATSHVDDKYGVDVDDIYEIEDILPRRIKEQYSILLSPAASPLEDELHLGYLRLEKL